MEIYRRESRKVIDRFVDHRLTFFECRAALDAVLVDLTRRAPQNQLAALSELISENGEIIRNEMEMREGLDYKHNLPPACQVGDRSLTSRSSVRLEFSPEHMSCRNWATRF